MSNSAVRAAIIFVIVIAALYLIGALAPSIFTWGFHFLGFLPKALLALYLVLIAVVLRYVLRGNTGPYVGRISRFMVEKPSAFLLIACCVFAAFAVALRINVPLLGDSFLAVKIFSKAAQGPQALPSSHSPLSLYFFYPFMHTLGAFNYPEILNAFLIGDLLLGCGFIITIFFTVRNVFEDPAYQCLSFLLLLVLPYMQLFFGYVELYAVVLFFLALYVLCIILYFRQKIHFAFLPVVFAFLMASHYMNVFLVPSFLYLCVLEFKRNKLKQIAISSAIFAGFVLLALVALQFDVEKFRPPPRGIPILTITPSENVYQAYTLFSPYHFSDLVNLAMFLCPAAIFLIIMTLRNNRDSLFGSPLAKCLLMMVLSMAAFICIARFDIPLAQDWDVPASYAYLVALYALIVATPWLNEHKATILPTIVLVTLLGSLSWWYLNSTVEPNITRMRQFIDKRISSPDGIYQSTYHLGEHYIRVHDMTNIIESSEQFIKMYPRDKRVYTNYTLYLSQFGKPMDEKITGIFERWLAIDSTNADAREQFANFHLDVGNRSYREGSFDEAIDHFKKAVTLTPNMPDAYNGLGITYRKLGNNDSALYYYYKTLALDSTSVYAYINLGNLSDDMGNTDQAVAWYKKALTLQPNLPQLHYNIGITYYKRGDATNAMVSLRQAARLGDADAQAFLRERGEQW
jgi:tetratricopeptide (TPR) repeat protein